VPNFFQDLGENTCSFQPGLKNTAPGLKTQLHNRKTPSKKVPNLLTK